MERRIAERKTFSFPVEYDLGVTGGEMEAIHSAQAQDICADGLRIVTDYPLEQGAVLRLNFPESGLQAPLPVFAEVAWATPADDRFNAGLRFLR